MAGMLVIVSFLPALAFAENTTTSTATNKKVSVSNFCVNLSSIQTKTASQITKAEEKQSKNEGDRLNNITKKESIADAKKAQGRSDVDAKRLKNWDKMVSKAKTDTQKSAVEAYKTAISNAVTVRRTSVDAAVKAYRDALTAILSTHSGSIDGAILTFKTSVDTALTKAQTDCTAGISSKTVKSNFNNSISEARKVLQDARKTANDSMGITTLKKTRDEAIKAAEAIFKQATEKARADLLIALK